LREFVYLDEVSVYSLSASRSGPLSVEFTDIDKSSLGGEIEGSLAVPAGAGGFRSKTSSLREQSTQIVRKANIQSAFKKLYELESGRLILGPAVSGAPQCKTLEEFERLGSDGQWLIDPASLSRGLLFDLEVELEAEAIYRVNAVISAILEIVQEDAASFGITDVGGLAQARLANRVLDKLLAGLVPLRGVATEYVIAYKGGREAIVRRSLLEQMPADCRPETLALSVVAVTQSSLFWKDVRRVAFSGQRYRVFGRVAHPGLRATWSPVMVAEVLDEVVPGFGRQLTTALTPSALTTPGNGQSADRQEALAQAAQSFCRLIAEYHKRELSEDQLGVIATAAADNGGSLESTDDRRRFFGPILQRLDEELGVATPSVLAAECRLVAAGEVGYGLAALEKPHAGRSVTTVPPTGPVRFLEAELVAVYW